MTPAEYYDWWFYSGICPGVPTRPANHAALRERLSAPGVHLIVLSELLRDNAGFGDTSYIAPTGIHGSHKRIAAAAGAVGATRLADYLSTLPDTAIVPETHREVKKLLKQFAARHKAELAGDIARHGDPRAEPGFDKRQARRQIEEQWGENNQRYQISDRIPLFAAPLNELRTLLARGLTLAQASEQSDDMAGLAACIKYDFPRWAESPQPPDVARFLDDCRRLTQQYPDQLPAWGEARQALLRLDAAPSRPAPEVSADRSLLDLLQAIGAYQAERIGPATVLTWDAVAALNNLIGPTGLRLTYEGALPPQLPAAWAEAQRRFAAAIPAMTRALLASGRKDARQRGADDDLGPDDDDWLSQVAQGMLSVTFDANEPNCRLECWWEVAWDPEHRCSLEIDERGGVRRVE